MSRVRYFNALWLLGGLVLACGEDLTAPETGTIEVTSVTGGDPTDPNGYALAVDGMAGRPLGTNSTLTLAGLPAGSHTLSISGLAPNCTLSTPNPLTTTVPAGGTARVVFEIGCSAPGALEVTTTTTGQDLDPDGYTVSVDGGAEVAVALDGQATIADLLAGGHSVRLSGLAPNCAVAGPNPIPLAITAGGTQSVRFDVLCSASAGQIVVTTQPGGTFSDPNGYTVSLDGRLSQHIGIREVVTFFDVAPGIHSVQLTGLAPGCGFLLVNPQSVAVSGGAIARVSFNVICIP